MPYIINVLNNLSQEVLFTNLKLLHWNLNKLFISNNIDRNSLSI